MRKLVVTCAVVLALLRVAPASAANSVVGNWSTTVDWNNQAAGLSIVLQIGANGRIHEHVMNHMGMAYDLFGTYRMDASGQTMHFTWTDYSPKQICVGGNCTPMGPPDRIGVAHTSRIQFKNPNFFTGTTEDGSSAQWVRAH